MHWDTTPSGISGKRCRRSWSTCTSSCWLPCAMPDWWCSRLSKNRSQQAFQWLWSSEASGIFCNKKKPIIFKLSQPFFFLSPAAMTSTFLDPDIKRRWLKHESGNHHFSNSNPKTINIAQVYLHNILLECASSVLYLVPLWYHICMVLINLACIKQNCNRLLT